MDRDDQPFEASEHILVERSADDLKTLVLASNASDALGKLLERMSLPKIEGDPPDEWKQQQALLYLGMIAARSVRTVMALVTIGYHAEALVFKRRLSEAHARVHRVMDPVNGKQQARAWLDGRDSSASSVVNMPDKLWHGLSRVAHADYRAVEEHLVTPGEDGMSNFRLLPYRDIHLSNGTLVLTAMEARDVAVEIAIFLQVGLNGLEDLDRDLQSAADYYLRPRPGR